MLRQVARIGQRVGRGEALADIGEVEYGEFYHGATLANARAIMPAAIAIGSTPAIGPATPAIGMTLRSGDLWSLRENARRLV